MKDWIAYFFSYSFKLHERQQTVLQRSQLTTARPSSTQDSYSSVNGPQSHFLSDDKNMSGNYVDVKIRRENDIKGTNFPGLSNSLGSVRGNIMGSPRSNSNDGRQLFLGRSSWALDHPNQKGFKSDSHPRTPVYRSQERLKTSVDSTDRGRSDNRKRYHQLNESYMPQLQSVTRLDHIGRCRPFVDGGIAAIALRRCRLPR